MTAPFIRPARADDVPALTALAHRTFRENFTHYAPEALDAFLAARDSEAFFAAAIADSSNRVWLVEHDGALIGYATLGAYKLPFAAVYPKVCELHRLYVLKAWHGHRLGGALMELIVSEAERQGAQAMYLGVWEHNLNAQAFYRHYGFEKVGEYAYPPIGKVVDCEWIMAKAL